MGSSTSLFRLAKAVGSHMANHQCPDATPVNGYLNQTTTVSITCKVMNFVKLRLCSLEVLSLDGTPPAGELFISVSHGVIDLRQRAPVDPRTTNRVASQEIRGTSRPAMLSRRSRIASSPI